MNTITEPPDFVPSFIPRSYSELVRALPSGATLQLTGVTWQDYEDLLADLDEQPRFRLTYDHGDLEIMTLSPEHESYKGLFGQLIQVLTEELDTDYISLGSTTLRDRLAESGAEADDCFYIGDFASVAGKDRLNLMDDPPPDLAIEIDITHPSLKKLAVYAELKVREIWRFDGKSVRFYLLARKKYKEVRSSDLFPFLPADILPPFLTQGRTDGINAMRRAFRRWVSAHKR